MKKILIILMLLILSACSKEGYNVKLKDGSSAMWEGNGVKYDQNELFLSLKNADYKTKIVDELTFSIAEAEEISVDTVREELKTEYESNENYAYYYPELEDYLAIALPNKTKIYLNEKYINDNFDEEVEKDKPYEAIIVTLESDYTAKATIELINNQGMSLQEAIAEQQLSVDASDMIYVDSSELPIEVKEAIDKMDAPQTSQVIEAQSKSTDEQGNEISITKYYIVQLISKNIDEIKDKYIEQRKNQIDPVSTLKYYVKKHNVVIHDQTTYDLLKNDYEVKYQ